MPDGNRRIWPVVAAFCVLALSSVVHQKVLGIAESNLTNSGFDREHDIVPSDLGIAYSNVTLLSDDLRLAGWWMPGPKGSPNATAAVVLVHGHSANMSKVVRHWGPNLHAAGYSLLAFDLRNHGASADGPGGYVTYGTSEARDVVAALSWLRANATSLGIDGERLALYGESMGGSSALIAAGTGPPGLRAVVTDSAYASFAFQAALDGAKKGYPGFLVDWVVADMDALAPSPPTAGRPDEAIAKIDVPLLLMHCSDDVRIQPASLHELAARSLAPPATWFRPCPHGESKDHHVDGWATPGYNETVRVFLGSTVGR